jgi:hypothetical protein
MNRNNHGIDTPNPMNATAPTAREWRGVFFDGPQSDQNHDGDEIPVWFVYVGNEDAEPTDHVYRIHDFHAAEELAHRMSRDRRLELIQDAMPD